jgi:hypothetical protein
MQVKVLPDTTDLTPALLHVAPVFTAACAEEMGIEKTRESVTQRVMSFFSIMER